MLELTVFISVKIANLNELSKLIPKIVSNEDRVKRDKINIKTEIKYLFISAFSNFEEENSNLFT